MSKITLAAGIVRDLEFDCEASLWRYLQMLDCQCLYKELDRFVRSDGSVVVRILTPFRDEELIEL